MGAVSTATPLVVLPVLAQELAQRPQLASLDEMNTSLADLYRSVCPCKHRATRSQ
jgi:hypothetical protein